MNKPNRRTLCVWMLSISAAFDQGVDKFKQTIREAVVEVAAR